MFRESRIIMRTQDCRDTQSQSLSIKHFGIAKHTNNFNFNNGLKTFMIIPQKMERSDNDE